MINICLSHTANIKWNQTENIINMELIPSVYIYDHKDNAPYFATSILYRCFTGPLHECDVRQALAMFDRGVNQIEIITFIGMQSDAYSRELDRGTT